MKGHGERCEVMIDHRSYKDNLSSCEMKFKYVIFKHIKKLARHKDVTPANYACALRVTSLQKRNGD